MKQGYKESEIGIIPAEWEVKSISDSVEICNNFRLPISEDERNKMRGDFPYYGPTKIQDYINEYRLEGKYVLIGEDGDHFLKYKEQSMTILTNGKFNVNNHAHILKGNETCSTEWIYYYFQHKELTAHLTRQGAGRYKLTKESLSKIKFPIPSIYEQNKISEILNTYDITIDKTSNLINRKENWKKALMQKLLSGDVRFKEFKDERMLTGKLSDYVDLLHGYQFRKEDFTENGIPVIKIGNVNGYNLDMHDLTFISEDRLNEFGNVVIKNGDLLMSLTGNIGRVVEVRNIEYPIMQNYRVGKFITRDKNVLSKEYLKHLLGSEILTKQFINLSNQSAQANFGKQDMDKLYITFTSNVSEQLKIAAVLSTSDDEIQKLKTQLKKLKLQKKGLMQLLLTGKLRVKTK